MRKKQSSFKYPLACEIHELLDIPLDAYKPRTGSKIINAVFSVIKEALLRGENVYIRGFGTFEIREHKSRILLHPMIYNSTGKNVVLSDTPITIAAKKHVVFKPAPSLEATLNPPGSRTKAQRRIAQNWKQNGNNY